ncbi:MAG: HAMP domain-containing sensor histidine kinase [bacterium]|nr:HAMP domain-containing sensor histidine kinase [bacterium]
MSNIYQPRNFSQLNELVNSLLILSKLDNGNKSFVEKIRIDEVLYNSIEKISTDYANFKVNFNIDIIENLEDLLEIDCNQNLLEIVFTNLLKNAYLYSDNKAVSVHLIEVNKRIAVQFSNSGETLTDKEQLNLFMPFMRGNNAKHKNGLGLGLKIVQRILTVYGIKVSYQTSNNMNVFTIQF